MGNEGIGSRKYGSREVGGIRESERLCGEEKQEKYLQLEKWK